ncbi:hypothetical protein BD410DRAFT_563968 [Rickenella mellea]|uniref:Uncharacterized protein n=1 Tax=Rickenella mellea TaxID=50990 RepID=A0A4Y7QEE9_9AGAM|nr:hypothetical protein BD410DRAFT_563968 [Rickenella mellea]
MLDRSNLHGMDSTIQSLFGCILLSSVQFVYIFWYFRFLLLQGGFHASGSKISDCSGTIKAIYPQRTSKGTSVRIEGGHTMHALWLGHSYRICSPPKNSGYLVYRQRHQCGFFRVATIRVADGFMVTKDQDLPFHTIPACPQIMFSDSLT